MTDIVTEQLTALKEISVSAIDGVQSKTVQPVDTLNLGTFAEYMLKMANRLTTPSAALVSGGTAPTVAVAFGTAVTGGLAGLYQGIPFEISATGTLSGNPSTVLGSAGILTTGTQIRKVGVALSLGDVSAVLSSIASNVGTLAFVAGSVFTTGESLASTGGESALYTKVPTPKFGPEHVPVGLINIPNSFTDGDGITNTMMTYSLREIQGLDFTSIIGTPTQP